MITSDEAAGLRVPCIECDGCGCSHCSGRGHVSALAHSAALTAPPATIARTATPDYEGQTFAISQGVFVGKYFRNCRFEGPALFYIVADDQKGSHWTRMGDPIALRHGDIVTECVLFSGCHFFHCDFDRITPIRGGMLGAATIEVLPRGRHDG